MGFVSRRVCQGLFVRMLMAYLISVSWCAWPQAGENIMTSHEDELYRTALAGKLYMMGVSPQFYTNLPEYNKNWYSSSESLWFDRWEQVLRFGPDFVQIITCEDDFAPQSVTTSL